MFTQTQLDGMGKLALRSACRDAKVPGYGKMRVADMRAALAQMTTVAEVNAESEHEDCCPLCAGDPTSQTWATEGKTCFCHECGKTWSIKTRKDVRTGKRDGAAAPVKVEKDREERNGVKRPSAGGACRAVWDWLDKHPDAQLKDVRAVAEKKGWNANNAAIELYQWRKFNGVASKRAK